MEGYQLAYQSKVVREWCRQVGRVKVSRWIYVFDGQECEATHALVSWELVDGQGVCVQLKQHVAGNRPDSIAAAVAQLEAKIDAVQAAFFAHA